MPELRLGSRTENNFKLRLQTAAADVPRRVQAADARASRLNASIGPERKTRITVYLVDVDVACAQRAVDDVARREILLGGS